MTEITTEAYDSDLEDYDTDREETANFSIELFKDKEGGLNEYSEERDKRKIYPIDGNVKDKPWTLEGVDKKEFFNYGLNEHQWKLLVNKHILMLYEKHAIIRTHPHTQAAQRLALKQFERNMTMPGMMYPGYPMQYYDQGGHMYNEGDSQYSEDA